MASKIKVDQIQTGDGTGTIALQNQLSGMTHASVPTLTTGHMPSGSALQVVRSTNATATNTSSTSYVTLASLTITPNSTTNEIHLSTTGGKMNHNFGNAASYWYAWFRGSTQISQNSFWGNVAMNTDWPLNTAGIDTPGVTTAVTYYFKGKVSASSGWLLHDVANQPPLITATEIKA